MEDSPQTPKQQRRLTRRGRAIGQPVVEFEIFREFNVFGRLHQFKVLKQREMRVIPSDGWPNPQRECYGDHRGQSYSGGPPETRPSGRDGIQNIQSRALYQQGLVAIKIMHALIQKTLRCGG
jgi:hypothetical protein